MTTFHAWADGDRENARTFRTSCHRSAAELWAESEAEENDDLVIERCFVWVLKEGDEDAVEMVVTGHVAVTYQARNRS